MKKKELKELSTKSKSELTGLLAKANLELGQLILEKEAGKIKDTNLVSKKRHDLARVKMFIRLKELNEKN